MKRVFLFPLSLILLVGMACTLGQSVRNNALEPAPTQTLIVQVETPTDAVLPTEAQAPTLAEATAASPAEEAAPTTPPTSTPGKLSPTAAPTTIAGTGNFFSEKFTGDISDFTRWVTVGDSKKHYGTISNGMLRFELPAMDTYAYVSRNGYQYADVYVQATGNIVNGTNDSLAVICRVSDAGWDEFRISARGIYAGTYEVYRYDQSLVAQHKVPYINLLLDTDRINSMDIKTGIQKNTIGMSCSGQELRIFINGVEQTKHNKKLVDNVLTSGGVGVAVIGYNNTASTFQIESLETSKPQ